jgi:hypothetical protein
MIPKTGGDVGSDPVMSENGEISPSLSGMIAP